MPTSTSCEKVFTITVPAASCWAYFKCDEATPINQLNNSVDAFHLPLVSAIPGTSVAGKIATAITADGDYHTYRSTNNHWRFVSFTLRFWYKPHAGHLGNLAFIFNDDVSFTVYRAQSGPTISVEFSCNTLVGGVVTVTDAFTAGEVDAWNRVVCWFENGVGLGIKINAHADVLQATSNALRYIAPSGFVVGIDRFQVSPEAVDEVALWNRKLTSSEMLTDWNAGAGKTYPNVP